MEVFFCGDFFSFFFRLDGLDQTSALLSSVFFDAKLLLNVLFVLFVSDMNIFKSSLALKSTELRSTM